MLIALRRLRPYLTHARWALSLGLLAVVVSTVLSVVSPWLFKSVVDGLLRGIDRRRLAEYALLIMGMAVADGWLRYEMRRRLFNMAREVECDIRRDLFTHLTRLAPSYFQSSRIGALMARVSDDAAAVRVMLGQGVMNFASYTLGVAIAIAAMLWIDPRLTLVAVLPLLIASLVSRRISHAIRDNLRERQAHLAELSAVAQEGLVSIKLLKACCREAADFARFARANNAYAECKDRLISRQSASYTLLRFSFFLSSVLVLWIGGADVIAGRMTLGQFVAFSRYLMLLGWPFTSFGWVVALIQGGIISFQRILDLLDLPTQSDALEAPETLAVAGGCVEARHLSFSYEKGDRKVLDDVSFTVSSGGVLAIVGATGSGRSTLASLLCGIYPAPKGMLFVDGVDIADLSLRSLRQAVSVSTHDAFIFGDTVSGNIAFGLGEGTALTKIERAAELAHLTGDIATFAEGFDTRVGERGVKLSGGQRQRLALARAVVRDSKILVLDDALSAVDTETETRILANLRAGVRSRICIVMAHRISTVCDADQILVLHGGRIVERGSHSELLALGGVYTDMYSRQSIEEELAEL